MIKIINKNYSIQYSENNIIALIQVQIQAKRYLDYAALKQLVFDIQTICIMTKLAQNFLITAADLFQGISFLMQAHLL